MSSILVLTVYIVNSCLLLHQPVETLENIRPTNHVAERKLAQGWMNVNDHTVSDRQSGIGILHSKRISNKKMAGKNNLALTALSVTLGLLFVLIGVMKLTPAINQELHKEMVRNLIIIISNC